MRPKALIACFALFLVSLPISSQEVIRARRRVVSGGGTAPTIVGTPISTNGFSPFTLAVGTVSVNDIVDYYATAQAASQTFTVTLTGGCAATGGNVIDIGPTNQGFTLATAQKGHFRITTGGSCTLNLSYASANGGTLSGAVVRGSSGGVDVVSAVNNQNAAGTGTNAVTSGTAVTTTQKDLCIAGTWDSNLGAGTLTAGNTIAWTLGTPGTTWPSGNEYFTQSSSGSIQATFTYSVSPYAQTALTCYKP